MTGYMAPYMSNTDRLIAYLRRRADYQGSEPENFRARYLEGLAVQARASRPRQVRGNVLSLRRKVK